MTKDEIDKHLRTLSRYVDHSFDAPAGAYDARRAVVLLRQGLLQAEPQGAPTCRGCGETGSCSCLIGPTFDEPQGATHAPECKCRTCWGFEARGAPHAPEEQRKLAARLGETMCAGVVVTEPKGAPQKPEGWT